MNQAWQKARWKDERCFICHSAQDLWNVSLRLSLLFTHTIHIHFTQVEQGSTAPLEQFFRGFGALLERTSAVPKRRTDTSPTASPYSKLGPYGDLNRRPPGSQAKSPQTELLPPKCCKASNLSVRQQHLSEVNTGCHKLHIRPSQAEAAKPLSNALSWYLTWRINLSPMFWCGPVSN